MTFLFSLKKFFFFFNRKSIGVNCYFFRPSKSGRTRIIFFTKQKYEKDEDILQLQLEKDRLPFSHIESMFLNRTAASLSSRFRYIDGKQSNNFHFYKNFDFYFFYIMNNFLSVAKIRSKIEKFMRVFCERK